MNGSGLRRLDGQQRQQALGLGVEDLAAAPRAPPPTGARRPGPVRGAATRSGASRTWSAERVEVVGELPADRFEQQLVAAARELAVDRRPREPRLLHDVLDRRLGEPEPRHAPVRRRQQAVAQRQRIGRRARCGRLSHPHHSGSESTAVTADDWIARDAAVVWHGFTQMSTFADERPDHRRPLRGPRAHRRGRPPLPRRHLLAVGQHARPLHPRARRRDPQAARARRALHHARQRQPHRHRAVGGAGAGRAGGRAALPLRVRRRVGGRAGAEDRVPALDQPRHPALDVPRVRRRVPRRHDRRAVGGRRRVRRRHLRSPALPRAARARVRRSRVLRHRVQHGRGAQGRASRR